MSYERDQHSRIVLKNESMSRQRRRDQQRLCDCRSLRHTFSIPSRHEDDEPTRPFAATSSQGAKREVRTRMLLLHDPSTTRQFMYALLQDWKIYAQVNVWMNKEFERQGENGPLRRVQFSVVRRHDRWSSQPAGMRGVTGTNRAVLNSSLLQAVIWGFPDGGP